MRDRVRRVPPKRRRLLLPTRALALIDSLNLEARALTERFSAQRVPAANNLQSLRLLVRGSGTLATFEPVV